jgi:uncharacterized protein with GYD domain
MTIEKSQKQSFNQVGVHLESQVFTYGQFYVALSRGKSPDKINMLTGSITNNVRDDVSSEVILQE